MQACLTLHDTPLAAPPFARSADRASSASASKLVAVQPPYCTGDDASCWAAGCWAWGGMSPQHAQQMLLTCGLSLPHSLLPLAEKGEGAAELLAARGFALLLMLAECEEPSFMDQVRRLGKHGCTASGAGDV